jgi:hypothetical protein
MGGLLLVQEVQDGALGHGEGRSRQVQPGMCCWVVGLLGCRVASMNGSTQANYHHARQCNIGEVNSSSIHVRVSSRVLSAVY